MIEGIGEYYTINHVTLLTGLTDRTIRNYIRMGLLQGEKINGLWHFTPEQVDAFVRHPMVLPSIQAKQNAVVYDFLLDGKKQEQQMCTVLDLPGCDPKRTAEYFCYTISHGEDVRDVTFYFSDSVGAPRVILKGGAEQIMRLVQAFFRDEGKLPE